MYAGDSSAGHGGPAGNQEGESMMKRLLGLSLTMVFVVSGCATMGAGMTDEEKVAQTVQEWREASEAKDIDAIMATVSEDFVGDGGANKDAFRQYIGGLIDSGMFDGVEISDSRAITTIDGDTAEVRNLDLSSYAGAVVVDLTLQRDADGKWRIVGLRA
jgi:ketosteroid isomerase-like protein